MNYKRERQLSMCLYLTRFYKNFKHIDCHISVTLTSCLSLWFLVATSLFKIISLGLVLHIRAIDRSHACYRSSITWQLITMQASPFDQSIDMPHPQSIFFFGFAPAQWCMMQWTFFLRWLLTLLHWQFFARGMDGGVSKPLYILPMPILKV